MNNLQSRNLVVIDIETSGINPFKHEVLSIALVPLTPSIQPCVVHVRSEEILWSVYAKKNFEKFAGDWSKAAVPPIAAYDAIQNYIERSFGNELVTAIGHNVGFDIAFMRKLAFLAKKEDLPGFSHRALDTHTMLYLLFLNGKLPHSALSSDGAFEYFEIKISDKSRHTALGDALATRELVLKLLDKLRI